jgi:hypothetical protein
MLTGQPGHLGGKGKADVLSGHPDG